MLLSMCHPGQALLCLWPYHLPLLPASMAKSELRAVPAGLQVHVPPLLPASHHTSCLFPLSELLCSGQLMPVSDRLPVQPVAVRSPACFYFPLVSVALPACSAAAAPDLRRQVLC